MNLKIFCGIKIFCQISMNRIQSKDHKIGIYKIKNISLSCFEYKTYIQNNVYGGLGFGY